MTYRTAGTLKFNYKISAVNKYIVKFEYICIVDNFCSGTSSPARLSSSVCQLPPLLGRSVMLPPPSGDLLFIFIFIVLLCFNHLHFSLDRIFKIIVFSSYLHKIGATSRSRSTSLVRSNWQAWQSRYSHFHFLACFCIQKYIKLKDALLVIMHRLKCMFSIW